MQADIKHLAFVVDIRDWAFDNIAQSISKSLPDDYQTDIIYWEDYNRPEQLVKTINESGAQLVHFFYRDHLNVLLNVLYRSDACTQTFLQKVITTHVPDYLYCEGTALSARFNLFNFCDGYFAANSDLFAKYKAEPLIADPLAIIYDKPFIPPSQDVTDKSDSDTVTIVWCGNSEWGEYAGYKDYKGLNEILIPAIERLRERYKLNFICFDSARKHTANEEILATMEMADIVLIASVKEGTPLTLIEAMAQRCAVVSTKVGIVPEVLPGIQRDFICERSEDAFYKTIERLITDRNLLEQCKQANYDAYQKHFGSSSPITQQWLDFFSAAQKQHHADGHSRKNKLLNTNHNGLAKRLIVTGMRSGARFARKSGMVPTLNRLSPAFAATYHRVLHGNGLGKASYNTAQDIYARLVSNLDSQLPVAIYAPMWKGVTASTEAIFEQNALRFPLYETEYPEIPEHHYCDKMADILLALDNRVFIYSGGSKVHLQLARKMRQSGKAIRQYFMWHGSPAQWIDQGQFLHFQEWRNAFEEGTIDGMITVKPQLHHTLNKMGIAAFDIINPIPDLSAYQRRNPKADNTLQVGLFSAINSWYKNPNVQLLAMAAKDITLNTNIEKSVVSQLGLNISRINYHHHLPRHQFLNLLAEQDINLYVTNTECSPMMALESWALNIPCIVSPAGDIFSSIDPQLGNYLVEPRADDPNAISDRFEIIKNNIDEIKYLMITKVDLYNKYYNMKKNLMISAISF